MLCPSRRSHAVTQTWSPSVVEHGLQAGVPYRIIKIGHPPSTPTHLADTTAMAAVETVTLLIWSSSAATTASCGKR